MEPNVLQPTDQTAKMVVIAALIGGLVSMPFVEKMSRKQGLVALLSGCAMAYFLAEPFASIFSLGSDTKMVYMVAFLTGMFGRAICFTIFLLVSDYASWKKIIVSRFSKEDV